jgi:hypothetical protein
VDESQLCVVFDMKRVTYLVPRQLSPHSCTSRRDRIGASTLRRAQVFASYLAHPRSGHTAHTPPQTARDASSTTPTTIQPIGSTLSRQQEEYKPPWRRVQEVYNQGTHRRIIFSYNIYMEVRAKNTGCDTASELSALFWYTLQ